jgi:RNA polymerase sigma factor (sigma-70 family)
MATDSWNQLLRYLRRVTDPDCAQVGDGQLIERFLAARDEAAFTALVRRHGPMVFALCCRLLHDEHDAEDAFQATFLVLARKAASVRRHRSLGGWLHEVAYHLALRAKTSAAKRQKREQEERPMTSVGDPALEAERRELHALLDEELRQLPSKYREALILCYLEGKTNEQAAEQLGWPLGSM